jgi:(2Fe-2S) ferredoxin
MIVTEHFERCLRAPEPNYKVFRVYRNSGRRKTLYRNLTLETAKRIVNSFHDSEKSMVCFTKQ